MAKRHDELDDARPDVGATPGSDAEPLDADFPSATFGGWPGASVFFLRARQPFEHWVREQMADAVPDWSFPEMDRCQAVLTPELPRQQDAEQWLRLNHRAVFERQLRPWTEDEALWPADRSLEALHEWFEVMFAPVVEDMTRRTATREISCAPVSLRRMRDEFIALPADGSIWVDVDTGEIVPLTDEDLAAIEDGYAEDLELTREDADTLEEALTSGSLMDVLPREAVSDRSLMLGFARSVEPPVGRRLLRVLTARKGARRFTEAVAAAGLRDRWATWRHDRVERELMDALDACGVPFVDDVDEDAEAGETSPEK